MGRIHEDHATFPVNPGVSQHESGSSQSAQPGDRVRMDATQEVVLDLLHQ